MSTKDWTPILNSVRTPLGFFTLTALILDAVMIAIVGTEQGLIWVPIILLAVLIVFVFAIAWARPHALYHPNDWPERPLTVSLVFPIEPIDVDLDSEKCLMEIRDKTGKLRLSGTPSLTFGHGGWALKLTQRLESADSVRLKLTERNGRCWRANPFTPFETAIQVLKVN